MAAQLALAVADARCSACTCPSERQQLLTTGVVEAARHFMATSLCAERLAARADADRPGSFEEYDRAVGLSLDALQTLRDALAAERAGRG